MAAAHPGGGASEEGVSGTSSRLQGLQRENGRLQEQLRSSEELNSSLRSELDLHRSIMAQTSTSCQKDQDDGQEGLRSQACARNLDGEVGTQEHPVDQRMNSGKLQRPHINWCLVFLPSYFVCVAIRPAGRASTGDSSSAIAFGGEHSHQRSPSGAAGEEAG